VRVLVIDDNPSDRALAIRELQRQFPQLEVQEIRNLEEFERALAANAFNLVITDYELRWTTGLEVLRSVKQRYPYCPVIMFTGSGSEEIAVEAMKTGLDDYVLKTSRQVRLPVAVQVALDRAEQNRRAALLEIRLQGLLDQLRVGIFRANAVGELVECNPAFLELLGFQSLAQAQVENTLNLQARYVQLSQLPSPQRDSWEVRLQRWDGSYIWVLLSTALVTVDHETLLDGLMEDISARKQAELTIQQLNQSLEQRVQERTAQLEVANQSLEEFTYSVSHDLQEPLRAIQGFASLLLDEAVQQLQPRQLDYLQRIVTSSSQASRLIQSLLGYSQISRMEVPVQPLSLERIVVEALSQLNREIQSRQATVEVIQPLGEVLANRTILIQVMVNLLSNAVKFTLANVAPQIKIYTENRGARIRLWVEDNGIGVEPAAHRRIFNVFERLHSNEIYPGTGIGLAIVRKGIERLGGEVGVESQLGEGSRFWFDLPPALE
jgi:PAS domain S-box-containing protein